MLISVIVPVYKVEDYLEDCIESILQQSHSQLQIILVDDGSTDSCPEICDNYAKRDARIEVIHRENGGLSAARNSGLKVATGEYVYFLDSDDKIYPRSIELLVSMAEKYPGVDIVQGNIEIQGRHSHYSDKVSSHPEYVEFTSTSESTLMSACPVPAWNKLIRRSLLNSSNITFGEGLLHEDELFRWELHKIVKTVAFVKLFTYWYRTDNQSSIMSSSRQALRMKSTVEILRRIVTDATTKEEIFFAINLLARHRKLVSREDLESYGIMKSLSTMRNYKPIALPLRMEINAWTNYLSLYNSRIPYTIFKTLQRILLKLKK